MNAISVIAALGALLSGTMMAFSFERRKRREMLVWAILWAVIIVLNTIVVLR